MRRMYSLNQLKEIASERVKALVEGGTLENAKPIYYHPITLRSVEAGKIGYVSFTILDNNPNAYTKETLVTKLNQITRISPLSGAIENPNNNKILICGYGYKFADNFHGVLGIYTDGTYEDGSAVNLIVFLNYETTTMTDGINKIN